MKVFSELKSSSERKANSDDKSETTTGAYPNPARTQVTLVFKAGADEKVPAELMTANGKVVRTVQQVSKRLGALNALELSLAELPTGLYFYRIITQKAVQQGRFIKAD